MKKSEKMQKRLSKARARLERADTRSEQGAATASVRTLEANLARALRAEGQPDPDLEKAVQDWKKAKKERRKRQSLKSKSKKQGDFYTSDAWRAVRYKALVEHGRKCLCCGATPETGAVMHVDHVKPRSTHPELELEVENLQVLCADCNFGKSNRDDTDFRGIQPGEGGKGLRH